MVGEPAVSPSRPREHQLETESERAFRAAMPSSWYVRRPEGDCGIDLEVEIFDQEATTGLSFRVQLKGTDSSFAEAPWVGVKTEALKYWRTLDSPVLLVRFDAPSGQLHAQWSHSIRIADGETKRVRFEADDLLDSSAPERLATEVSVIRGIKAGLYRRHIPISLVFESTTSGVKEDSFRRRLRAIARDSGALLRIVPPSIESIKIILSGGDTVVALPTNLATIKLDANSYAPAGPGTDLEQLLANDCVAAVALLMCRVNATSEGLRIARLTKRATSLWRDFEAAEVLAEALFIESEPSEALSYARELVIDNENTVRDAGQRFMFPVVHQINMLTERQRTEVAELHASVIKIEETSSRPSRAGAAHYNYGQLLASQRRWDEAVAEYEAASSWNPTYLNRDYWHRELGGYLFDLGRYSDSANSYREALRLLIDESLRGDWQTLHADALIYAGQYADAQAVLKQGATPSEERNVDLSLLNQVVLDEVVVRLGIDSQDPASFKEAADELITSPESSAQTVERRGALNPHVWVERLAEEIEDENAFTPAVILATLLLNSAEAWFIATITLLNAEAPDELRIAVVRHALRHVRDDYLERMDAFGNEAEDGHREALAFVQQVEAGLPDEIPTFTARLIFDPSEARDLIDKEKLQPGPARKTDA
jgi:tetratricopeptide (TPR) repeat protein